MKLINVSEEMYTDPNSVMKNKDGTWQEMQLELLRPNPKERFIHWLGFHFSFGQSFCVVCGRTKTKS